MSYQDIKSFRSRRKESIVRCLCGKCNRCGYNRYNGALDLHHKEYVKFVINLSNQEQKCCSNRCSQLVRRKVERPSKEELEN